MKKIDKTKLAIIEKLRTDYNVARSVLLNAINDANTEIADLNEKFQKHVDAIETARESLNNIICELNDARQEVADDIESYIEDKSDNWRDGERGSAYSEWQEAWSNEIDDVEVDVPDKLEEFDTSEIEALDTPLEDTDYPHEPNL